MPDNKADLLEEFQIDANDEDTKFMNDVPEERMANRLDGCEGERYDEVVPEEELTNQYYDADDFPDEEWMYEDDNEGEALAEEDIPDNEYFVRINEVYSGHSDEDKFYVYQLQILDPTAYRNGELWKPYNVSTPAGVKDLLNDLEICGFEVAEATEVQTDLLKDLVLQVEKKSIGKGYYQIRFIRVLPEECH